MRTYLLFSGLILALCACEKKTSSAEDNKKTEATAGVGKTGSSSSSGGEQAALSVAEPSVKGPASVDKKASGTEGNSQANAPTVAKVGEEAPNFTLTSVEGKSWSLKDYRGKVVVLEWFNPECPFVKNAHNSGQLKTSAADLAKKGVVWVAINSNAKGKQGFGKDINLAGKKSFNLTHPVLLDPTGSVGKLYRATRTPHMMVVDAKGKLAYRGALDNTGGGDAEDAPMGVVINYVEKAVDELLAGKQVTESEVRPWGCGVKYAN